MSIGAIIAVVIAVIIVVAAGTLAAGELRRRALIQRFGPEYDRLVSEKGTRRAGAELTDRQRLLARLDIRQLTDGERESYARRWSSVQEQFVDDPHHSVNAALALITAVLKDRGYPTDDGDEAIRAVSVEHARALQDYHRAQKVTGDEDNVSTEDLRQALLGYRSLFRELTSSSDGQAMASSPAPAPAPASAAAPARVPAPAPVPDPAPAPALVPVPFPPSVRARMARMNPARASAADTTSADAGADDAGREADLADRDPVATSHETEDKITKELPMTTGPEKAQGAMKDTSADVPNERDVREIGDEQDTPGVVNENSPEAAQEDTPEAAYQDTPEAAYQDTPEAAYQEDTPEAAQEDTAPREQTSGTGATGIPQQSGGTVTAGAGAMGNGGADPDVSGPLLTETEERRSSWQRIQAGFVDDPRGSVAQAAMMVEETAETLVATIQERERVLRGAWEGNGAAADTEKLRITLGKYRTFLEKITRL